VRHDLPAYEDHVGQFRRLTTHGERSLNDPGFGFLSMAYFTPMWLALTAPIYMTLVVVAIGAYRWGPERMQQIGMSRRLLWALGALIALTFVLGGVFGSRRIHAPSHTPPAVWCIWALLALEVILSAIVVRQARRPWVALVAVMPLLWIGAVVAKLAAWTITAGGTLGAL
jgi:hypothetical protein